MRRVATVQAKDGGTFSLIEERSFVPTVPKPHYRIEQRTAAGRFVRTRFTTFSYLEARSRLASLQRGLRL